MRLPRKRGTSRLRRAADWVRSVVEVDIILAKSNSISSARARSVGGLGGLVDDHDGNVVANRINTAASVALESTGRVGEQTKSGLTLRANEDIEKILRNRHKSRVPRIDCSKL